MRIQTFKDASWNSRYLEEIADFRLQGLEFSEVGVDESSIKMRALSEIVERISKSLGNFSCWVISGHEVPQANSRIIKHKKFLTSMGISVPSALMDAEEWMVPAGAGIKFFALISKAAISDEEFLRLCGKFKTTWLIFSKDPLDGKRIPELLKEGWEASSHACPANLLRVASEANIILVRDFGPTDDLCSGAVVIGNLGNQMGAI